MVRKRAPAIAVVLVLLVVTAGCSGTLNSAPDSSNTAAAQPSDTNLGTSGRTIQVVATGQAEAKPTQAIVRVSVVTNNQNATAALQTLAKNSSQLRTALSNIGITESQIQTIRYGINNPPDVIGYQATHAFRITVNNTNRTGKVIETAVTNGATRVGGIRFTIGKQTRQQLQSTAITRAMSNAQSKAKTIASQANLIITGVQAVQTGTLNQPAPRRVMLAGAATAGGGVSPSLAPGSITVSVRLTVTYNAIPKN